MRGRPESISKRAGEYAPLVSGSLWTSLAGLSLQLSIPLYFAATNADSDLRIPAEPGVIRDCRWLAAANMGANAWLAP